MSLDGAAINGPTNEQVPISQSLATPGTYNFTIYGNPGSNASMHGLNLLFGGNNTPSISLFAPTATDAGSPAFAVNTSSSTRGLNAEFVSGAGTNIYTLGSATVTLTAYRWETSGVKNQDLVSPYNRVPNGVADNQGSFTLVVTNSGATAAPEPGSIVLTLVAGVPLIGIVRRRRAR